MSGKPTFSLFPFIKNDFGSPEAEQVPSLLMKGSWQPKNLYAVFVVTIIAFKKLLSFSLFQFFLDDINLERCFPDGKWTKVSPIDKNEKLWIPCDILADLVLVDISNRLMLVTSQVCQPECHPDCQRNMAIGNVLWHRYQVEVGIGRHVVNFTVGFTILFGMETFDGAVAIDKVGWSDILFC